MEILGLAIVVILILVATLFIVRFLVIKKPSEVRKGFISTEIASNMLNTFLNTNADDCNQMTMTELLQDCARAPDAGGVVQCSDTQKSCSFVRSKAISIFEQTLDTWNIKYIFLAYLNPSQQLFQASNLPDTTACIEKKSRLFPMPVDPTSTITMYVKLDICQ